MSLTNNTTKHENLKSKLPRGGETDNCNIACSSVSSKKIHSILLPMLTTPASIRA